MRRPKVSGLVGREGEVIFFTAAVLAENLPRNTTAIDLDTLTAVYKQYAAV